jgi:urea transport system permease protein
MTATDLTEALFNGLSFSSILILTALGLAITFGVMRVINMAHGEMLMLGAYTAFILNRYAGLGLFWSIPASFFATGAIGYVIEVSLIRFLYGRPLDTLLATWGVGLILQKVMSLGFGQEAKLLGPPSFLDGSWQVGSVTFGVYRVFVVAFTVFCLATLYLAFFKTSFGLKVRAVTQNRAMASAVGISTRRVDSLTFALGTGLAGVAGCIMGHMYSIKADMGASYVVDAFMVVILGGVGQLSGTVAGGTMIGTGNSVVTKLLNNEPIAKVLVLLLVIVFIQFRPSGMFAPKERVYD